MAQVTRVDDPADPRLADYLHLRDADLRRRVEEGNGSGHGIFIAEGLAVIRRLLASIYPVRSVLLTPARYDALADTLEPLDVQVLLGTRELLRQVAGFDLHRGAVAAADRLPPLSVPEVLAGHRAIVVLEGINDHENLGAIARTAAGLGAGGLVLDPTSADPLYRRCVRVSMGAVLHLPFARSTSWPGDLGAIQHAGFRALALTPSADATPLRRVHLQRDERVAVLLGAEGPGLTTAVLSIADERVCIPLPGPVDSLNVGHAAAIALHHLLGGRAHP